jgi:hypothetical protein
MLRPTRYGNASDLTKHRALEAVSCFGQPPVPAPVVVSFEDTVNPGRRRATSHTLVWRLLLRPQCRRQEHGGGHPPS